MSKRNLIVIVILSILGAASMAVGFHGSYELRHMDETCAKKCKEVFVDGTSRMIEGRCVCFRSQSGAPI